MAGEESANFSLNIVGLSQGSSDSDMSQTALDNLEKSVQPQATKQATDYGVKKFKEWLKKRNRQCDFHSIGKDELNEILRKFYAEVRGNKQQQLSPSTMTSLRAAIHRYISSPPFSRPINILKDTEFQSANKMFDARCKLYYQQGNPKPQHKSAIEEDDLVKLGRYFSNWDTSALILLEATWFHLCLYFGRRGREGWASMNKETFSIQTDVNGEKYVTTEVTESTKNNPGGSKQSEQDYSDQRMYGPGVEILEFYLEKLNGKINRLWQYPVKNFLASNLVWYRSEPLGKNYLATMMQKISKNAGLSKIYTCHCVRASTVTTLFRKGISAQKIIGVTKHRSTASLGHYIDGMSTAQKKECSSVLTEALGMDKQPRPSASHSSTSTVVSVKNNFKKCALILHQYVCIFCTVRQIIV